MTFPEKEKASGPGETGSNANSKTPTFTVTDPTDLDNTTNHDSGVDLPTPSSPVSPVPQPVPVAPVLVQVLVTPTSADWLAAIKDSLLTAEQLQQTQDVPRQVLLEPFFNAADFGILFAQRGVGKTWEAYLIAHTVASGTAAGPWKAPKARKVLFLDAEMPLDLAKERNAQFETKNGNLIFLHHQILFDRAGLEMNLAKPEVQNALEEVCVSGGIELLILDNQSTLLPGDFEDGGKEWDQVLPWLLRMQRRKIAVMLVVHAGRNNQARGHSRREDRASWMIRLSDRKEDDAAGARFISEFTKPSRNCTVDKTPQLLWEFTRSTGGKTTVSYKPLTKLDQFRECLQNGMGDDPKMIAEELGISQGYVSKLATKGVSLGWCKKKGRLYMFVS